MDVAKFRTRPLDAGRRLDQFVADSIPELSRSRATRLIRDDQVTVDGRPADPDRRLAEGSVVVVRIPDRASELTPERGPLEIIVETEEFVAVDKPKGTIVHPGARDERDTLAARLVACYPELNEIGHPRRPGIVHRLDKNTSGVLLVARTQAAYQHFIQSFSERRVSKRYVLIAHGIPSPLRGQVDARIGRDPTARTRMAVTRRGRPAETDYATLGSGAEAALVEARPTTGRTHQIRVHMAAIGHPVWGDAAYGPRPPFAARPMLHSWTLGFDLPDGSGWLVSAPPPDDFANQAEALGLTLPETPKTESR